MLRAYCAARTDLTEEDIGLLEQFESTLKTMADLVRGDVFIDCVDRLGQAFVAAHAAPQALPSQYKAPVCGLQASLADEPAVYGAFNKGVPFHDTIASTQEHATVAQDVTPICNAGGTIIGVLIAERDVTRVVNMERKLMALSSAWAQNAGGPAPQGNWEMREAYHRVKNHLQIISNICGIKARTSTEEETREALLEISGLIKSISSLQTLLCGNRGVGHAKIALGLLLDTIFYDLSNIFGQETLQFKVDCDDIQVSHDAAVAILMVVNELVDNAVKHGLPPTGGLVCMEVRKGTRYGTACLTNSGYGLPPSIIQRTGLPIVREMVAERLKGDFYIRSTSRGTQVVFSFLL